MNRARIILLKADGESVDATAEKVGLNRNNVLLCMKNFREGGVDNAIYDTPGRGRNPEITDDEKTWIIDIACRKPTEFGYPAETWTYPKLTAHIQETAEAAKHPRLSTISKTMVVNILNKAEVKPFRIKYYWYLFSRRVKSNKKDDLPKGFQNSCVEYFYHRRTK